MKLTIVIPCLNLWNQYTKPCLRSIRTRYPYRIVLIDNGSTDETCVEAPRLVSDSFVYRRNETNSGTCKAWNWGICNGFENSSDIAFVLNNDVLLHSECIDRLVARVEQASDRLGLASGLDITKEIQDPQALFAVHADDKACIAEVEDVHYSAFMITRNCWQRVGPFDEAFYPAYFEDDDYRYRTRLSGFLQIILPTALFYHFGCRTQIEAFAGPMVAKSAFLRCRDYYIRKWGGPPDAEKYRTPFGGRNSQSLPR
jgi:GT2 family glycosyltransferase